MKMYWLFCNPGAYIIKHFTAVIYGFSLSVRVFVPGKPFQPSLVFAGEARSLPSSGAPQITAVKSFIVQAPVGIYE